MKDIQREDLLEIIGCEIELRPDAPTIVDLAPLLLAVQRCEVALTAEFPAAAATTVEAFAAAERRCCSSIHWNVAHGDITTLRITAGAAALDVIEQTLRSIGIEERQ